LDGLAELLKQELMGEVVRRDAGMTVTGGAPGAGATWGLADMFQGESAAVHSFVKTERRDGASVLLQSDRSEPILAVIPRGRGTVAQITSLQGAEFLWGGSLGLRGLVRSLAQVARSSQGGGPRIVAFEGDYFLVAANGEPRLQARTSDSQSWVQIPLEWGLGDAGLHPREWLRLDLGSAGFGQADLLSLELRMLSSQGRPERLVLPVSAPAELLPGGHVWPRELPRAVVAPASMGSGVHPSGPAVLVLGLLSVVLGLGFQVLGGKGSTNSADRN